MRRLLACLLLTGLVQAVQVYLNPSPVLPPKLSPKHAGFALSRHLGLEFFETAGGRPDIFGDLHKQTFVAQGPRDALLLTMNEGDARDVIPPSLEPSFSLDSQLSSLSSLVSTFLHRAPHAYSHIFSEASYSTHGAPRFLDIFSVPSSDTRSFLSEMSILLSFLESDTTPSDKFGAFELKGLSEIAQAYGRSSDQYKMAVEALRAFLQSALTNHNIHVALLTHPSPNPMAKREPQQSPLPPQAPAPQLPIGSVSTCHSTAEICANVTSACSGRGQCMEASKSGRTCFICACSATIDEKGRKDNWAGEACERKDISGPFVLLAGTVVGLLVVVVGSVSLLYGVGEQKLPSTLTGGIPGSKRD